VLFKEVIEMGGFSEAQCVSNFRHAPVAML